MANKLYRVIYKNKGIYSAIKELMSTNEWNQFINLEEVKWLPNPGEEIYEQHDCITFFTEKGIRMFEEHTLPIIQKWINNDWYNSHYWITTAPVDYIDSHSYIYQDEYQVIVEKKNAYW